MAARYNKEQLHVANVERIKGGGIDHHNIKKILLIQFGDLGDVIVTFPCLRALKENFPEAGIVLAVHEKAKDLVQGCRWCDDVLAVETRTDGFIERLGRNLNFARRIRRLKFDLVFDLRTGDRSAFMSLLTGAGQRVSFYGIYNTLWRNRIYSHLVLPDRSPDLHMVDYYLSLLNAYGIDTTDRTPTYTVTEEQASETQKLFRFLSLDTARPIIAYHAFSLWEYKGWDLAKHAEIIQWLVHRYNGSVLLTGTNAQFEQAEIILKHNRKDVYNLAGKTSLNLLPALLQRCHLSMGVDTAGGHIAAAVGTPTVTIFGPGNFAKWAPCGSRSKIVHKGWDCIPCNKMGCNGSGKSRCLIELSVSEVKADLEDFLDDVLT